MVEPAHRIGPGAIGRLDGVAREGVGPASTPPGGTSFKAVLANSMAEVNRLQQDADTAITKLQTGQNVDLTQVMVAVEKADLAFKTLMQIRNKLVEAYKQIEQMRL